MVSFTVVANGEDLSYQWFRVDNSGTNEIDGATEATYNINATDGDDGTRFLCRVSNSAGSVMSDPAVLTLCKLKGQEGKACVAAVQCTADFSCIRIFCFCGNIEGHSFSSHQLSPPFSLLNTTTYEKCL